MVERGKTSIVEWTVEFCRIVSGRHGTVSMDIYILKRMNPDTMITFSVPHGERKLPEMLAKAMNAYVGYEPDIDLKLLQVFHGPWVINSTNGRRELRLTMDLVEPIQNLLSKTLADKVMLEHELKTLRSSHDKVQRAYMVLEQQVLRLNSAGEELGEDGDGHPDLFEGGEEKAQTRFDVV